ncbi:3-hydroxydecanoyl-ACP dehydratase [Enterovibrio norvegicus FF-33]|uniref:ApeP family dehydratase n=1 Tax=Enterovibrio TaxID=188143 RepID=UPI0002E34E63|nr:hotdog family protein [Enterovibrio norvegicus]OEE66499.1 3-hydroxydecanoyl-ACP dehydratase [Enterovibrio norvegicus FF-33]
MISQSTAFPPIKQLVPHRAPMLYLNKMVDAGKSFAHCQARPNTDHHFFDTKQQGLPSWVGIELMAQTIAAWSGFHYYQKGQSPVIGFLVGSRRYQTVTAFFARNQVLDIHVDEVMSHEGVSVFSCKIESNGALLASSQLSTFEPSNAELTQIKQGGAS